MADLTVLIPVPAPASGDIPQSTLASRPDGLAPVRVGLLGNSKANVDQLFAGLRNVLEGHPRIAALYEVNKLTAQGPASPEMYADLIANSDVVVTAMAD